MNVSLLKERFKAIKQETVDVAVSSINAYRGFIGNGVAVGKLAEPIFAKLLNAPEDGFYAFHFAFTGKNPPFDVMLYRAKAEIPKSQFTDVKTSNLSKFSRAITKIVDRNNWCGISIKNYKNKAAQISTNYKVRIFCEKQFGLRQQTYSDAKLIKKIYKVVVKELRHEAILFLNSFPETSTYQLAIFDPTVIKISKIILKKGRKHKNYIFYQDDKKVFHVKYGKNQANPYQRGLWVDDLSKLTILRRGNFRETNFGEFILEGAFRIHPPARKA